MLMCIAVLKAITMNRLQGVSAELAIRTLIDWCYLLVEKCFLSQSEKKPYLS